MTLGVYVIRDVRTGFLTPTTDMNDVAAMRNFEHAMMQSGSLINSHPEDYALCRIGRFNNETGELIPEPIEVLKVGTRKED